jgi:oligopeptide transport system substrate-binding protein
MHYTAYPVPKHIVERHGDEWVHPENIAVNGAFKLMKWWSIQTANAHVRIQAAGCNPAYT